MWAKCKVASLLTAFVTMPLFLATSNSAAQQVPVEIEHADLWGHYIRPLRMIHSQDPEARRLAPP